MSLFEVQKSKNEWLKLCILRVTYMKEQCNITVARITELYSLCNSVLLNNS